MAHTLLLHPGKVLTGWQVSGEGNTISDLGMSDQKKITYLMSGSECDGPHLSGAPSPVSAGACSGWGLVHSPGLAHGKVG